MSRQKLLTALSLLSFLVLSVFSQSSSLKAAPPVPSAWVCFPTCTVDDAKLLTITAAPGNALSPDQVTFAINSAPGTGSVTVGVFDADARGSNQYWDDGNATTDLGAVLTYTVIADPAANGTGTTVVGGFVGAHPFFTDLAGAVLPGNITGDNAWFDFSISNTPLALGTDGAYHYRLQIVSTNVRPSGLPAMGNNHFKVRTDGTLGLTPTAFGFYAPIHNALDIAKVFPLSGGVVTGDLSQTTYDGVWEFAFTAPGALTSLSVWDGDLDYGNRDCNLAQDTDDPDTNYTITGTGLPFPIRFAAVEGVGGVGSIGTPCVNGAPGQAATGNPADDSYSLDIANVTQRNFALAATRKPPASFGLDGSGNAPQNIVYKLIDVNGNQFRNFNPSGNIEWEQFRLDTDTGNPADFHPASISGGTWRVRLEGQDMGNLSNWYYSFNLLGFTGPNPTPENAFYQLSGVAFFDSNSSAGYDSGEPLYANLTLTVRDGSNTVVARTTTDSVGAYLLRVPAGTFTVTVDSTNTPVALLGSSTGGFTSAPLTVGPPADAAHDFGFVVNRPPTAVNDTRSVSCGGSVTIGVLENDTDPDNDTLLFDSFVSSPAHGTTSVDAFGQVTYTATGPACPTSVNFDYRITDGKGGYSTATVTVNIITQYGVVVTVPDVDVIYDGDPHPTTCTVIGDDEAVLAGTLIYSMSGVPVNAGDPVLILCEFHGDATHSPGTGTGTITIHRRPVTITAGAGTKAFGDVDPPLTAITVGGLGFIAADEPNVTLSQLRDAGEDVGSYPTNATASASAALLANYDISYIPNAFTITILSPTATATGGTFPYDGNPHAGTCTISDGLTGTLTYVPGGATAPVNVGTYAVECDYPGDTNHNPAHDTSSITITPRAATVTAGGGTKVYGSADPALTAISTSGFVAADLPGITLAQGRVAGENVGGYAVDATATGGNVGNYTVTYNAGNFTITKRTPTATATGGTFVYNGSPRPGTCTISHGLVGTLTYTPGGTSAPVAVGTYTVNCNYAGDANNNPASATATITITPEAQSSNRMTGGGTFGKPDVHHGFELHCDATRNPNRLEVNWGKGDKFHLEELTTAVCSRDPLLNAKQPTDLFNTYVGTGKGRFNGVSGATATWTFTDGGEPGTKDKATIVIKNAAGQVVLSASGFISKGNQQAHK